MYDLYAHWVNINRNFLLLFNIYVKFISNFYQKGSALSGKKILIWYDISTVLRLATMKGKRYREMFYIVKDHLHHPDIGNYVSYGIGVGTRVVPDISTDRSFVEALAAQFEENELAPEHLQEAVEDAIILSNI